MSISLLNNYLSKHRLYGQNFPLEENVPDLIVVIPCYDEPDLWKTLESLDQAVCTDVNVEIVVVVNDGEHTPDCVKTQNDRTYTALISKYSEHHFSYPIIPIRLSDVKRKYAGAGYARKVGMDWAVWRLVQYENPGGVIVSLDADTLVATNYLRAIYNCFNDRVDVAGVIIAFEHSLHGDEYDDEVYLAVMRYELHLRYLNQGLKYSGFPYVYHTIGSAFAVRASVYAKHGGMNRRQGGEDFYFLHKLFPHEVFVDLNSTCVYPSARPSHRVPFGTGPQVRQSVADNKLLTYHPDVFDVLKVFFRQVPKFYNEDVVLPELLGAFFADFDFESKLYEIRNNASSKRAFIKRFYAFFDAFQVVKFLNFSHQNALKKIPVEIASTMMLEKIESPLAGTLIEAYRKIEGR